GTADQQAQGLLQAFEQHRERHQAGAGGGQLDGQRQAVEAGADGGDLVELFRGWRGGVKGGGAGQKELDGGGGERSQGELDLALDAQEGAAGDHDFEARRSDGGDETGGVEDMLEVVEDQQEWPGGVIGQMAEDGGGFVLAGGGGDAENAGDLGLDLIG